MLKINNKQTNNNRKNIDYLWKTESSAAQYGSREQYFDHIFNQYQICINAAEKIAEKRNIANTFFLSLNTFFITCISLSYDKFLSNLTQKWILIFPLMTLLLLCYLWWRLLKSYSQLNYAKYRIIHEYEKHLPSSPYLLEWIILEEGKNPKIHQPLTDIEKIIPIVLSIIYVIIALSLKFV